MKSIRCIAFNVLLGACSGGGGKDADGSPTDTSDGGSGAGSDGSSGDAGGDVGSDTGGETGGHTGGDFGGDSGVDPGGEWALISGIYSSQYAEGVVVDEAGDVFFGGSFVNGIDLGDGGFASMGGDDILVGRLSGVDGSLAWNVALGDEGSDIVYDVALGPDGALYAAGWFEDDLELPEEVLTSKGDNDGFLARWEADGTFAWAVQLGGTGDDRMRAVSADADGACVAGFSTNGITGTGLPLGGTSLLDGVVVCVDTAGTPAWGTTLGFGGGTAPALAIDVTDSGVRAGGYFTGELDLGSGRVASAGGRDGWFMAWPRAGGAGAGRALGATGDQEVRGLARSADTTYAVGSWAGGATPVDGAVPQGESDAFVVDVEAPTLGPVVLIGGSGAEGALDIAYSPTWGLALVGYSDGTLTLAESHEGMGDRDIWVGIYDGGWTASARYGGPGEDVGRAVDWHPSGDLIIGGTSYGSIDIGGAILAGYGDRDLLLARVSL